MRDTHKYYYTDSVAGWLCIIQHLFFTELLHSTIYMTENNKCFLQMHLLAEALHSGITPDAGMQSLELKYYSWIVSLSSIIPSSADKSIRLA